MPAGLGEAPPPGADRRPPAARSPGKVAADPSGASETLLPFMGAPPSRLSHLPQTPSPDTIILGWVIFQHINFGETHSSHSG